MLKTWIIEKDKLTDYKVFTFKQKKEILKLIVYDVEKITHKKISDLRSNKVLSAVDYEIDN